MMTEEKYSQNERIKKFTLIVCGLTFVSVVLSLLTYWVYVQWNKVEPKKGKLSIYNLKISEKFKLDVKKCFVKLSNHSN